MQTIDEYLAGFKRVGILEHLSASEMAALEEKARALDASSPLLPLLILQEAPGTVFTTRKWRHAGDQPAPSDYEAFLNQMFAVAHGKFLLENAQTEMIKELLPNLPRKDPWDGIRVRFELEGQSCERTAFLSPHSKYNEVDTSGLVNEVNRALVEAGRDERFYWIIFYDSPARSQGPLVGYALIVLTTRQERELTHARLLLFDPDQPFTWTLAHVEDLVKEYHDLGLLDHLSREVLDQVEQEIRDDRSGWLHALRAYPGAVTCFDGECIYEPVKDYTDLIKEIAAVAHGDFNVENIQIEEPQKRGDPFRVAFDVDGRSFACQETYTGDWVQWEFLEEMNRAAAELGKKGRFMMLVTWTQEAMLAYLTEEQVRRVRESLVLRLDDYIKWV